MKKLADLFIVLSFVGVILAIIGAFSADVWLASTQWIMIAAVLSIWAIYVKMRT